MVTGRQRARPESPASGVPTSVRPLQPVGRDLLGLWGLPAAQLRDLLALARQYAPMANCPATRTGQLAGRSIALLFFEDSTRTRVSFELAAQRLSATVVHAGGAGSSISKGETLLDTARTMAALGVDAMVVRCRPVGAVSRIAAAVDPPVINAGEGAREHPTQALVDAYVLAEAFDRLDSFDLSGLRVVIVGDVVTSRVARSNVFGLRALGATVVCVGPEPLCPDAFAALGCQVHHDLDAVLDQADAVMMLRVQFERHGGASPVGSVAAYRRCWALTEARAARLRPATIIMHPGPVNRGLELDGPVADSPRSRIVRQVEVGVAVRMAVLVWSLRASPDPAGYARLP